MTTEPKKGIYWYIALIGFIYLSPMSLMAITVEFQHILSNTFIEHWKEVVSSIVVVAVNIALLRDLFVYKEGYTKITTTEYQLFKCRESGSDDTFMMFADTEQELERFFEKSMPNKVVFIEPLEMSGKSIEMKVFNESDVVL